MRYDRNESLFGPREDVPERFLGFATTISFGMQNVFDSDPPFVAGVFGDNFDRSLATIKGRFWYVQLKKRF